MPGPDDTEALPDGAAPRAMRRYAVWFPGLGLLVAAMLAAVAYGVDPYQLHVDPERARRELASPSEPFTAWAKTRAIWRDRPETLFLGNSRVEIGLPTEDRPGVYSNVFNAAITNARIGDLSLMVAHALAVAPIRTVVLGIDYPGFQPTQGNRNLDRALVAEAASTYALRRFGLELARGLSTDVLGESFAWLLGAGQRVCRSSIAARGQRDSACHEAVIRRRGGVAKSFEADVPTFAYRNWKAHAAYVDEALPRFGQMIGDLCRSAVRVRIFIQPSHILGIMAYRLTEPWDAMEHWKSELAHRVAAQRSTGCDVALFDFSGFNDITTEEIPHVTGRPELKWHWEGSHYRQEVGRFVLARVFGAPDPQAPVGFGEELTPSSLHWVLDSTRVAEIAYVDQHREAIAHMREWMVRIHRRGGLLGP